MLDEYDYDDYDDNYDNYDTQPIKPQGLLTKNLIIKTLIILSIIGVFIYFSRTPSTNSYTVQTNLMCDTAKSTYVSSSDMKKNTDFPMSSMMYSADSLASAVSRAQTACDAIDSCNSFLIAGDTDKNPDKYSVNWYTNCLEKPVPTVIQNEGYSAIKLYTKS